MPKRFTRIGEGAYRIAYESQKSGLVFKVPRYGGLFGRYEDTENEREFFYSLKPHERKYFPVVRFVGSVVVMKKCIALTDIVGKGYSNTYDPCSNCSCSSCGQCDQNNSNKEDMFFRYGFYNKEETIETLHRICEDYDIPTDSIKEFIKVLEKMHFNDLHLGNIGVLNNCFVLIDAG